MISVSEDALAAAGRWVFNVRRAGFHLASFHLNGGLDSLIVAPPEDSVAPGWRVLRILGGNRERSSLALVQLDTPPGPSHLCATGSCLLDGPQAFDLARRDRWYRPAG